MREIKFRAWDELEKTMWTILDAGESSGDGSVQYFSGENGLLEIGRLEEYDTGMGISTQFEKFPIMQFTGLKDKNGKEIYEGDVVEYEDYSLGYVMSKQPKSRGVIKWDKSNARYFLKGMIISKSGVDTGEVIGNIYENNELLEESE